MRHANLLFILRAAINGRDLTTELPFHSVPLLFSTASLRVTEYTEGGNYSPQPLDKLARGSPLRSDEGNLRFRGEGWLVETAA